MTAAILAIDPGRVSGWAIYPMNEKRPVAWGQIALKQGSDHTRKSAKGIREIVEKAVGDGATTMVIEGPYKIRLPKRKKPGWIKGAKGKDEKPDELGWKTYHSMGQSFGRWAQAALEQRMRIVEVNPRSWQSKTVGTGPRDQQIPKYKDLAKHLTGSDLPSDAAAAVVIGYYWTVKEGWKEATQ